MKNEKGKLIVISGPSGAGKSTVVFKALEGRTDMADTLRDANGVGLAAPQVGILRRAVIVLETNVAEGENEYIIELINPEIISAEGEQTGAEGCLSVPGEYGIVTRPMTVKVKAQNRFGQWFEAEGTGLTARGICHAAHISVNLRHNRKI